MQRKLRGATEGCFGRAGNIASLTYLLLSTFVACPLDTGLALFVIVAMVVVAVIEGVVVHDAAGAAIMLHGTVASLALGPGAIARDRADRAM